MKSEFDLEQPFSIPVFIGRDEEFRWLADRARYGPMRPLIIHGPPGIGKSAFLHYFAANFRSYPRPQVWTLPDDPNEAKLFLQVALRDIRGDQELPRVFGVDNADVLTPAAILDITQQVLNLKRIEAIIFTRREPLEQALTRDQLELGPLSMAEGREFVRHGLHIDFPAGELHEVLEAANGNPAALALLHHLTQGKSYDEIKHLIQGRLYGLDQGLVVPNKKLIVAARPRIITANEILVDKLRREPEGLYDLDPRKFEELIADLMEDMGYNVELTPRSKDGGKDILASRDTEHGKMLCLVEAKRYSIDNPIQVGLVRQLYGTLCDFNASSAMLVTTSRFTRGANEFQQRNQYRLALKDYGNIVQWLSNYGNGQRQAGQ